jgi:hypothetical protein
MAEVVWTELALADLEVIAEYSVPATGNWSSHRAGCFIGTTVSGPISCM